MNLAVVNEAVTEMNGVENQSVLAGFNVNQVVERQPVFLGNTL